MKKIDETLDEMVNKVGIKFKNNQNVKEIIKLMLQEILKHEEKQLADIKQVGEGGYSTAFQIGSKIIKIGKAPETYEIVKNSKRFLKPLIRRKLDILDEDGKRDTISLEITEAVDTSAKVTEKELYKIYKELREEGIIWTDAKASNVGRLLKSNVPHFNRDKLCTCSKYRISRRTNRNIRKRRTCYNRFGLYLSRKFSEYYMARWSIDIKRI